MRRNIFNSIVTLLILSTCGTALAETPEDISSPSVYSYFSITSDGGDAALSISQFNAQIEEIGLGNYTVMALDDIFNRLNANEAFLPNTIAITFDEPGDDTYDLALPVLLERGIPFALFISPGNTSNDEWERLAKLQKNPLVTIGLTSYEYSHLGMKDISSLQEDMNSAKAIFREHLDNDPAYFAYPFGEYSQDFVTVVSQSGFKAAFGQNSGVVTASQDRMKLPRFTMTDDYGDLDRFRTTSNAMPFPVDDVQPSTSYAQSFPVMGFTLSERIDSRDLDRLSCFSSGEQQPEIIRVGDRRVELRFSNPTRMERLRVNCTIPVAGEFEGDDPRYRWLGFLLHFPTRQNQADLSPLLP